MTNVSGSINIYYEKSQDGKFRDIQPIVLLNFRRAVAPVAPETQRVSHGPQSLVTDFHLDRAITAQFDCGDRVACTEGTRADVINDIRIWTRQYHGAYYQT